MALTMIVLVIVSYIVHNFRSKDGHKSRTSFILNKLVKERSTYSTYKPKRCTNAHPRRGTVYIVKQVELFVATVCCSNMCTFSGRLSCRLCEVTTKVSKWARSCRCIVRSLLSTSSASNVRRLTVPPSMSAFTHQR